MARPSPRRCRAARAACPATVSLVVAALAALGARPVLGAATAPPGSPTMGCWRNPEAGIAARCTARFDLATRERSVYSFSIPPRDVDNEAYDVEVELTPEEGNVDLYVAPPADTHASPLASTRTVGRDTAYLPRSSLTAGRYEIAAVGASAARTRGAAVVTFVEKKRAMPAAEAKAVKEFMAACCPGADLPCAAVTAPPPATIPDAAAGVEPDLCAAPGVVCARNGTLLELNLARTGLACDLAVALRPLAAATPNLTAVDLSGNAFTGGAGPALAALAPARTLAHVDLSATGLGGRLDDGPDGGVCALAASAALRSVAIVGAGVTGPLPRCLAAAPGLQALHADLNELDGDLPPLADTLAYLTLSRSRSDIPPSALGPDDAPPRGGVGGALPPTLPPSLVLLDLTSNSVTGALPTSLPAGLAELRLGGNALSGALPPALTSPALTVLDVGGNANITGELPPSIVAAPNLQVLDVAACGLGGPLPKAWSHSLTKVRLARNAFDGPLPPALASLPSLVVLDASSNKLAGPLTAFSDAVPTTGSRLVTLLLADNAFGGGAPLASLPGLGRIAAFAGSPLAQSPPSAADRAASLAPARLDVAANPGLGGAFPAWLVDAVAACPPDAVSVETRGVPLTCPGAPFVLPRPPAARALAGLACTPPGGGEPVHIASLVKVTSVAAGSPHAVGAAVAGVTLSVVAAAAALALRRRRTMAPSRSFSRFPEPEPASPNAGACAALRVAGPGAAASKVTPRRAGSGGSV